MRRIHAIEMEDQPWLPRQIRDYGTDFLQFMIELGDAYGPVVPVIGRALRACGTGSVVDLGSGGGGPWPTLFARIGEEAGPVTVTLTDRFPNREASLRCRGVQGLTYHPDPVDAMAVPADLRGFRTLFTALHHFEPEQARMILADAVRNGQGIGAFEFSERSLRGVLSVAVAPLLVLLVTPKIRPFRWSRLFWTYLIPAVPLLVLFDGIVSCLRTYTIDELRDLAASVGAADYAWEAGFVRGRSPIPVSYLVGTPSTPQ